MNSIMSYKGFAARVEFDPRDRIFVGTLIDVEDSVTFHGESVKELQQNLKLAVNHYLEDCTAAGREPRKQYSGRIMLRIPTDVHAHAARAAAAHGMSLNQWAARVLADAE